MALWKTRPLSFLVLLSLSGLSIFAIERIWVRITLIVTIALGLIVLLLYLHIKRQNLSIAIAALTVYAISLVLSFVYFGVWFFPDERFEGESVKITASVTQTSDNEFYTSLTVKTKDIDGKPFSRYKLILTSDSGLGAELIVGDVIEATVRLIPLWEECATNEELTRAMASGLNAYGELVDCKIVSHRDRPILNFINKMQKNLRRWVYRLCDADSGSLFLALFAADRTNLSGALTRSFRRIGISHLLALSGMHLSILALLIHKLLSLIGVRRRSRIGILLAFVVAYMAFTGFPISVVRAGVMLIIGSLFFLFALPQDSITTLSLAVLLIVTAQPYALLDISLLLSALATLGILQGGEVIAKKQEKKSVRALLYTVLLSVVLSLFAMAYTTAVTVLSFDEISLLGALSTLLFSLLIEVYIYLGLSVILLPFLSFLPHILSFIYNIIFEFSYVLSDIPYASVSVDFPLVAILAIAVAASLVLYLMLSGRAARGAGIAGIVLFSAVYITALALHINTVYTDDILYYGDKNSEFILEKSDGEALLLDFSSYGKNYVRRTIPAMYEERITRLDSYMVFSYGYLLCETLENLLYHFPVNTLYLPIPIEESEQDIFRQVAACCAEYKTKIVAYQRNSVIQCGEITNTVLSVTPRSQGQLPILTITRGDELYFYAGSGAINYSSNSKTVATARESARVAIYGYRGRAYENPLYISYLPPTTEKIIVSGSNINIKWSIEKELLLKGGLLYSPWRLSLLN